MHTGSSERSKRCGYWLYLARGSGIYLDLGRTMVLFSERIDPSLAPYRPPGTGKGRGTPPFAYSRGFPNGSKVEVVHTGNLVGLASPPRYFTSVLCRHGLYVLVSVLGA